MIEIAERLPGSEVPQSIMFGHSTHLMDSFTPAIERIILPERQVPPLDLRIRVFAGQAGPPLRINRRAGRMACIKAKLRHQLNQRKPVLRRPDVLLLDGRFCYEGNIAHILQTHASLVRFAEMLLGRGLGEVPKLHVILPARSSPLAGRVFDFLRIPVILHDGPVEGTIVSIEPVTHKVYAVLPHVLNENTPGYTTDTPTRIYLSRRGSRFVVNEDEVVRLLQSRGFTRVFLEDLPFSQQLSTMRNAREIVAVHGAGLAWLVFKNGTTEAGKGANPHFSLVELFGPGFITDHYRHLVAALGGAWCCVRGQVTPEVVRDLDFRRRPRSHESDPFIVDPDALEEAVDYVSDGSARQHGDRDLAARRATQA